MRSESATYFAAQRFGVSFGPPSEIRRPVRGRLKYPINPRKSAMRSRFVVLGVLCFCVSWSGSSDLWGQEIYKRVPVDLNGGAFRATLPFRESFLLVGPAAASLREVTARHRRWVAIGASQDPCDAKPESGFSWINPGPRSWSRQNPADTFYMEVPELAANVRYVFCVETRSDLTGDALTQFQADAADELDRVLKDLDATPGGLPNLVPDTTTRRIRAELVKALDHRTRKRVIAQKGTLFDTTTLLPTNRAIPTLGDIIAQQKLRTRLMGDLITQIGAAKSAEYLGGLERNATLATFIDKLNARGAMPGVPSAVLERARATAVFLYSPPGGATDRMLRGEIPLDPNASGSANPTPVDLIWNPVELAPRVANLDESVQRLLELRSVVAAVAASPMLLQKFDNMPRAEAEMLSRQVESARRGVELPRSTLARMVEALTNRNALIQVATRAIGSAATRQVTLGGTSILEFKTRAKSWVGADLGLAALPDLDQIVPYFGANFYCAPLNRSVPFGPGDHFCERFAVTVGLTAASLKEEGERDNLFSTFNVLVGAGMRVADPIRVTMGAVILQDISGDPLAPDKRLALTPYASIAFDFDARDALGKVGEILSK